MIKPGTLVLFIRPTLTVALKRWGVRGVYNWAAGLGTACFQFFVAGPFDGYYESQHIGIVVSYGGRLCVLEIMPGGVRLAPVDKRLAIHPVVTLIPLNERYQALFDIRAEQVTDFIRRHLDDDYRWGGLLFAVICNLMGWEAPGAEFCAELVIKLLLYVGVIPGELTVLRGDRDAVAHVRAWGYSPCAAARLPQLKNSAQLTLRNGVCDGLPVC